MCFPPTHTFKHTDTTKMWLASEKNKQVRLGKSLLVCSNLCNDMDSSVHVYFLRFRK